MEIYFLLIALIILIIAVVIFRFKSTPVVSPSAVERLETENQTLKIELAKQEQIAQSLLTERQSTAVQYRNEQLASKQELQELRDQYLQAEKSLESVRSFYRAQEERLQAQKEEMVQMKEQLNNEFQIIANKILEEKTQKFTETNNRSLDSILNPLKDKLKSFEDKVELTYKTESAERNSLKGMVRELMEQSLRIKDEANNLTRALKGDSKKQGNWGEVILERVLERSGLTKDREYRLQAAMIGEDGKRLQPDAVIDLPDDKHLIIDSKVSLVAYEQWVNVDNDEERERLAKLHVQSIENHVKSLSAKNYQDLYQVNSPDFVLLFMPIESAFSMSISYKADLFSDAWDRRVVIVSPSTLLATLRTIASVWKQERQTRNVLEIANEAGALYDKFVGFLQDLDKVGDQLNRAVRSHEEATKKLGTGAGNVIKRVEKLRTLGAKASKQIESGKLDNEPGISGTAFED